MRVYYCDEPEGAEVDCPVCGSDAIQTDSGTYCPDCANE